MLAGLESALASGTAADPAIRGGEGTVYAARNVLRLWPGAARAWRAPRLVAALAAALGPGFGLVRGLYFDKPPGNSWALPWHKDLTVAVRDNRLGGHFARPTRKAGVPHVEAPEGVLRAMLTARIHLDPVTGENGPLRVVPGSHKTGKELRLGDGPVVTLHAGAGDVLLIRPLLAHASNRSEEGTARHRRILHLEFAAGPALPDGYRWHDFLPGLS
jgi:ectoine hydroxylase-related dioxygenase (phytanoyl-CoA dioxygenase family)